MKSLVDFMNFLQKEEVTNSTGFSLNHLKSLTDFNEILNYLVATLGESTRKGGTRRIWPVDEEKIIKVAIRAIDAEQNQNEVKHSKCLGKEFAPVIFDYDERNYFWVVEERLQPISETMMVDHFSEKFNHPFKNYSEVVALFAYINDPQYGHSFPVVRRLFPILLNTNKWFKTIVRELESCKVQTWDFHDENWGIRPSTGEIVLLDLGF